MPDMDWKIELVAIPVTDVDRAKAFYVEQAGFHADHDYQVSDVLRFVQLTPPGSACSIGGERQRVIMEGRLSVLSRELRSAR